MTAIALKSALAAAAMLFTPAGGYHGHYAHGAAAPFRVGAAVANFTPPASGRVRGGDPANCAHPSQYKGPRPFAFEEPYIDDQHDGHFDLGDPFIDCNHDGRWDGNLLGGGANTPRFYDHVADPVGARATVVSNGRQTVAVEVVDQEGLFNVYQQRIRAKVRADGYRLSNIFISATHDESAPDSLGLGGVSQTTSGVDNYWVSYLVDQSARAIERAYRARRAATIRYTEVLEPANVRQCWSSYPFVDDQHIPVLQAVDSRGRTIVTLASVSQHDETLGFNEGTPTLDAQNRWVSSDWINFFRGSLERRLGGVAIEMAGAVGSVESPEVYRSAISRTPQQFVDASHSAGCRTLFRAPHGVDATGALHVSVGYTGETKAFGTDMAGPIVQALKAGRYHNSHTNQIWGARSSICIRLQNELFILGANLGVFAQRPAYNATCTIASPVAANGGSTGESLRSNVAAFQIGDGEFISIPGRRFRTRICAASSDRRTCPIRAPRCLRGLCRTCMLRFASSTGSAKTCSATSSPRATPSESRRRPTSTRRRAIASAAATPTTPSRRRPRPATSSATRSYGYSTATAALQRRSRAVATSCRPAGARATLSGGPRSSARPIRRSTTLAARSLFNWQARTSYTPLCGCP